MADAMGFHGLLVIPVTGLDRTKRHQSAVANIAAKDLRGVCFAHLPFRSSKLISRQEPRQLAKAFEFGTRADRSGGRLPGCIGVQHALYSVM